MFIKFLKSYKGLGDVGITYSAFDILNKNSMSFDELLEKILPEQERWMNLGEGHNLMTFKINGIEFEIYTFQDRSKTIINLPSEIPDIGQRKNATYL